VNLNRLVFDMKLADTLFPFQELIMCNLSLLDTLVLGPIKLFEYFDTEGFSVMVIFNYSYSESAHATV